MSSQGTRKNRQGELERPLGAGPTPQANAEVLLAELKRLLESSGHPPFAHRRLPLRRCLRRPCTRLLQPLRNLGNRRTSTRQTVLTT